MSSFTNSRSGFRNRRNNESSAQSSFGNSGSVGSVIRRRPGQCLCEEEVVLRTINDRSNSNFGKKFWGCRNWKHNKDRGCNFFKLCDDDDDVIDERDLKIARKKKKNGKLKNEVCLLKDELLRTKKWLKISFVFGCVCFGINLVLVTLCCSSVLGLENTTQDTLKCYVSYSHLTSQTATSSSN